MAEPTRTRRVAPEPRPAELAPFAGQWVAVRDGEVIAAATAHELASQLRDVDRSGPAKLAIEYVRPATDSYIVGAG